LLLKNEFSIEYFFYYMLTFFTLISLNPYKPLYGGFGGRRGSGAGPNKDYLVLINLKFSKTAFASTFRALLVFLML
jgi:hypothetical protein